MESPSVGDLASHSVNLLLRVPSLVWFSFKSLMQNLDLCWQTHSRAKPHRFAEFVGVGQHISTNSIQTWAQLLWKLGTYWGTTGVIVRILSSFKDIKFHLWFLSEDHLVGSSPLQWELEQNNYRKLWLSNDFYISLHKKLNKNIFSNLKYASKMLLLLVFAWVW